ncbi:hypothetical protein [Mycoplasma crocodyli]|uniref:hypothetical protein n=1 Tax=Mycoplasma crocodyli TaxID=50052 RepID=UPI0002DA064D|nr:hypothetical protein [Mycoplasma crocodyli]
MINTKTIQALNNFDTLAKTNKIIYSICGENLYDIVNNNNISTNQNFKIALKFNDFLELKFKYKDQFLFSNFSIDKTFLPYYKYNGVILNIQLLVPTSEKKYRTLNAKKIYKQLTNKPSFFYFLPSKKTIEISYLIDLVYERNPEFWTIIDDNQDIFLKEIDFINFDRYEVLSIENENYPYLLEIYNLYDNKN